MPSRLSCRRSICRASPICMIRYTFTVALVSNRNGATDSTSSGWSQFCHSAIPGFIGTASSIHDEGVQSFHAIGLGRRLVPADPVDAGKAHGEAGLVAARVVDAVEGDLEDECRLHFAHRAKTL